MNKFNFDIVLITWNRPVQLKRALDSLDVSPVGTATSFQVIVFINGPDEKTEHMLHRLQNELKLNLKIITSNERFFPGAARNQALAHSHSDWVFFMDDDAWIPKDYFQKFEGLLVSKENLVSEIGFLAGPNFSFKAENSFSRLSQLVLENPLFTPYIYKRYQRPSNSKFEVEDGAEFKSILCNLWLNKKRVSHFFDPRLKGGEESELIFRLERARVKGLYSQNLFVWHERRPGLVGFIEQMIKYGDGRGRVLRLHGAFRWFHLIPFAALVFAPFLFAFGLFALLVWIYVIWLLIGMIIAVRKDFRLGFVSPILAVVMHLSYALGTLQGILMANGRRNS